MDKTYLKERKKIILREFREFENTYLMTSSERKEVHKWASDGNSIHTNPWYWSYENGCEMDYLDALRFEKELYENMVTKTQQPHANSLLP